MGQWVKITYILSLTLYARGLKRYLGVAGQAIYFNLVSRWPLENYVSYDVIRPHWVNSLLNGDALSWHKFWSTVPQVTCWRKATSHFHNKWWGVSIQIICNHYSDGRDSVSNHQPHDCLLDLSFRRRSKKTSMLRFTGLCVGNSPGTVNFPHEWPVTRKMFPFDDVIMIHFRSI